MMKSKSILALFLLLTLVLSGSLNTIAAPAPVSTTAPNPPRVLTYQGHLLDASGDPVADGTYPLTFSLWDAATGGQLLWGPELHDAVVTDGYFALLLGTEMPIDAALLTGEVFLDIAVADEPLTPRQPLASVAFALVAANAEYAASAADAALLGGYVPDHYRNWHNLVDVPSGFADGVDNDTVYTNADAVSAVAAAGYVTASQVISVVETAGYITEYTLLDVLSDTQVVTVTAANAAQLAGHDPAYYLDWHNLSNVPAGLADGDDNTTYTAGSGLVLTGTQFAVTGAPWAGLANVPAGFADGVDNDTVYTNADALNAVATAGYLTPTTALAVVAGAGYVRDDQIADVLSTTGFITVNVAYAAEAGNASTLEGQPGSYYQDAANLNAGTLDPARYSALDDLNDEGYLDGNAPGDLLTQGQGDTRYVNAGEADSVTSAMITNGTVTNNDLQDGAALAELLDDDGAGSTLDADLLDGQHGTYYRNATNLNAGTLDSARYSAVADLAAEGYLDNNADADLLTRLQGDGRYVNTSEANSVTGAMITNGTVTGSDLQDGAALAELLDDDGSGSGLDADLLDGQSSAYYRSWANLTNVPAGFADGVDNVGTGDITGVTAGTGLTGGGTSGAVTLNADTTYVQRRVSSTCAAGSSIRAINADGTVTCETDDNAGGDITSVTAGAGLTGGGASGSVTLNVDAGYVQRRVTATCAVGSSIRAINADGTVICDTLVQSIPTDVLHRDADTSVGYGTSLTLGPDGLGLIAYRGSDETLRVYHCADVACSTGSKSTLDSGTYINGMSIAVGADGLGVISYAHYNGSTWSLRVAHCTDAACSTATLATVDTGVELYTSIVIGTDGLPLIAYRTGATVKVAHCTNAACTSSTRSSLDTLSGTGFGDDFLALALGADGLGFLAYYDYPNTALKVAHCNDTACTSAAVRTLDNSGAVGVSGSVAIGNDGLPILAYYDDTNHNLKVAHCDDALCTSATFSNADTNNCGVDAAITIGADGLPVIGHQMRSPYALRLTHCADAACTQATSREVASPNNGFYVGITLGADGLPLLSSVDIANHRLQVTHCPNAFCLPYWQRR